MLELERLYTEFELFPGRLNKLPKVGILWNQLSSVEINKKLGLCPSYSVALSVYFKTSYHTVSLTPLCFLESKFFRVSLLCNDSSNLELYENISIRNPKLVKVKVFDKFTLV